MTKLLNLDELASTSTKKIVLKGAEHLATELTVQGYIDRVARAKQVDDSTDTGENLNRAMDLVTEVFPTLTRALLTGLPLQHLQVIIEFALAAPEDVEKTALASPSAVPTTAPGSAPANEVSPQGNV